MNNIKKAFKTKSMLRQYADGGGLEGTDIQRHYPGTGAKMRGGKSSLRCMADGGTPTDPRVLGQGSAAAAGALAAQAPRNMDAAIEAQMQGNAYTDQAPANNAAVQSVVPPAQPADNQPKMSWWHKYFGLADGGMPLDDLSAGARTGMGRAQYNRPVRGMSDETMTGVLDQEDRGRSPAFINRGSRLRGPFGLADGGQAKDWRYMANGGYTDADAQRELNSTMADINNPNSPNHPTPAPNNSVYGVGRRVAGMVGQVNDALDQSIYQPARDALSTAGEFARGALGAPGSQFSNVQAGSSTANPFGNVQAGSDSTAGKIFTGTGKFGERAFTDFHGIGDIASGARTYTPGASNPITVIHNDNLQATQDYVNKNHPAALDPMSLAGQFAALNKTIQGVNAGTGQGVINPSIDPKNVGKGGQFNPAQRSSFANQTIGANAAAQQNQANALSAINAVQRPPQQDQDFQGFANGGDIDGHMPPARDEGYVDTNHPQIQMARGGVVKGPGGPTDDEVGPVMLSKGEYVLPADTVKHVGKENLDDLRAKTHKFVGPRRGLRGMADGGPQFNVPRGTELDPSQMKLQFGAPPEPTIQPDPTIAAARQAQFDAARAARAAPEAASAAPAAAAAAAPEEAAVASRFAGLRGLAGRAGGALGTAGGALGAGMGAIDMANNGVNPSNLAQTAGGGLMMVPWGPAKIAGGALLGGSALYDMLKNTPPGPDTTPPPAGVSRGTQAPAASEPARPAALSTQQEDPELAMLRQGFMGLNAQQPVNMPNVQSNADSINQHYDALSKELHKLYTPKGAGNLALRLLSLEDARARALGQDQGNLATLHGHGVQQQQIAQQARELGLRGLGELYQKGIDRQIAQRQFQLEMAKLGRGYEEEGAKDVDKQLEGMFPGQDGKPDAEKTSDFKNFLEASALKQHGQSLYGMSADDRRRFTQEQLPLYNMLSARNAAARGGLFNKGVQTNTADLPTDIGPSSFNDVVNHHLPLSSYLYERLPFTNPNVVRTQSGQAVPFATAAAGPDGLYNMQQLQAIAAGTGKDVRKYARGLRSSED